MEDPGEPAHWKQKGLTLIGSGVAVLVLLGVGLFTVLNTMQVPL